MQPRAPFLLANIFVMKRDEKVEAGRVHERGAVLFTASNLPVKG